MSWTNELQLSRMEGLLRRLLRRLRRRGEVALSKRVLVAGVAMSLSMALCRLILGLGVLGRVLRAWICMMALGLRMVEQMRGLV